MITDKTECNNTISANTYIIDCDGKLTINALNWYKTGILIPINKDIHYD